MNLLPCIGSYTPFKGHITSIATNGSIIKNLGFNGSASGVTSEQKEMIKQSESVGLFGFGIFLQHIIASGEKC